MSNRPDVWKKRDRACPSCPRCGTELFEAYFAGGGWAPFEKAAPQLAHGDRRCVEVWRERVRAQLEKRASEEDVRADSWAQGGNDRMEALYRFAAKVLREEAFRALDIKGDA